MPGTVARLLRAFLCLGVALIPVLIPMAVARITAPSPRVRADGVNMFGLAEGQHQAVVIAIAVALLLALLANWLLRLGWLWIGISLVFVLAILVLSSALDFPQTIAGGLLIASPMVAGAATGNGLRR